jgi:putative transposase
LRVHKHLRRLERIWVDWPIYFITTCTVERRAILACKEIATILIDEWRNAHDRHGWAIGRYVIMPDHMHFFCRTELDTKALPVFTQRWKEWTSKRIMREAAGRDHRSRLQKRAATKTEPLTGIGDAGPTVAGIRDPGRKVSANIWQEEFFDHLLRSGESYSQKWDYIKENPARAGLVDRSDQWPWQGEIEPLML